MNARCTHLAYRVLLAAVVLLVGEARAALQVARADVAADQTLDWPNYGNDPGGMRFRR